MTNNNRLNLTVVICTHNRASLLEKTIESINSAEKTAHCAIELLVIPNACSDNTTELLRNYMAGQQKDSTLLPLRFEEEEVAGKSHALNRAIRLVAEDAICFVDDDHRVDAHFFNTIAQAIENYSDTLMFCGQIIPDWTGSEPEWIHDQGDYKIYPLPIPHFEMGDLPTSIGHDTKLPGGGNLIVHKKVFDQVGLFETSLGPKGHNLAGSEDSDFVIRAIDAGIVIQYVPDIIQYHYVDLERLKLGYLIRKSFERTKSLTIAKMQKKQAMPKYLWRKLLGYIFKACLSFDSIKIRFFLMRIASTLGEIAAYK
jgi:GT2 family glycosyltransferase